ncbi:MAG: hypothetical protein LBE37_16305 [Sphingobacterium sp.]|nr:hypothetical protein [Sphingobacterium sp.]
MTDFDFRHLDQHIGTSPEQRQQICTVLKQRDLRKGQTLMLDEDDLIYISKGLLAKVNNDSNTIEHFIAEWILPSIRHAIVLTPYKHWKTAAFTTYSMTMSSIS